MPPTPILHLQRRRGFTFAEVMFAVILLGIGFIMLAGMFPVAIQQTRVTQEETLGANLAQGAAKVLQDVAYDTELPSTGGLLDYLPNNTWNRLAPNLINRQDARYAWTAMYRRNNGDNYVQVVIFALQVRNGSTFVPPPAIPNDAINNLNPRTLTGVTFTDVIGGVDTVNFGAAAPATIATGAFVAYAFNGGPLRVYRVGNQINGGLWELAPGFDMVDNSENAGNVKAYTIGRGAQTLGGTDYAGPAMDIASYVTFIHLK